MEIDPIFPIPNFSAAQKIGCQGTNGANSETASQQFFPGRAVTFYPTFEHVFQAVERGEVEFGVLPVYNSTSGSVTLAWKVQLLYYCHESSENQALSGSSTGRFSGTDSSSLLASTGIDAMFGLPEIS